MIVHAGLVALRRRGLWLGALIEGPSGAGKSDLAMRSLEAGFRLAADDRVILFASEGALYGRAPSPLTGLIEARGLGVVARDPLPLARIALRVACAATPAEVERSPGASATVLLGVAIPSLTLWPFELSAPSKLAWALEHLGAGV